MQNKSVKALWIDVDQTLLDFDQCALQSMKQACQEMNVEFSPEFGETFFMINNGLWKQIEQGMLTHEQLKQIRFAKIFEALGIEGPDPVEFEHAFRKYLHLSHEPMEGALEALDILSNKWPLFVITNGPLAEQSMRLEKAGMLDKFQDVYASSEMGAVKPSREFFEKAFALCQKEVPGIEKDNVLVIGDSLDADITGALNFGLPVLWFGSDPDKQKTADEMNLPYACGWDQALELLS